MANTVTQDNPPPLDMRGFKVPPLAVALASQLLWLVLIGILHKLRQFSRTRGIVRSRYAVGGFELTTPRPFLRDLSLHVAHRGQLEMRTTVEGQGDLGTVTLHRLTFSSGGKSLSVALGADASEFSIAPLQDTCRREGVTLAIDAESHRLRQEQREEPTPFLK